MTSGSRSSDAAIARDRDKSRERARLRRQSDRDEYNRQHAKYISNNREQVRENDRLWRQEDRLRYGETLDKLSDKPFIFWDGEGYNDSDGYHHYMLFGCSHYPDSPLVGSDLSTKACLDYLLFVESEYPNAIHVGFVFDYDVNMILKDLPARNLKHLADYGVTHWQGYRIAYIPGKKFTVSYGSKKRGEPRLTVTIYDLFGFFHSKYTTALLKFGVATKQELEAIMAGKDERPNFTFADIEYVKKYWRDEISYGPPLADCIRDACYDAGLFVTQWHGPGALAAYILRKRGARQYMSKDVPIEVQNAIRYAYAGGRFQPWRCGLFCHDIYTADINSAYIYAFGLLPRLDNRRWIRVVARDIDRTRLAHFGLYHIAFDAGTDKTKDNHQRGAFEEIHPLFHRDKRGNIRWPNRTDGWYWSPEAKTVADNPDARFLEAWIYDDDGTRPFEWVFTEFDKRLELQRLGNPAEKTFKWGLAAMYGACARRVGWDRKNRKPPASHELAWAGFITSWCRAEMYRLGYECWKRGGLVSIDTDGVTSTVPFDAAWLERGQGERLGQWKVEQFAGIMYWQSGFYWLLDAAGSWSTAKTRGVKRGSLEVDAALAAYEADPKSPVIRQTQTRFVGFKEALNRKDGLKAWRRWVQRDFVTKMGSGSTSYHVSLFCRKCRTPDADMMHVITHLPQTTGMESEPHRLPWLEDQPELPGTDQLIIWDSDEADHMEVKPWSGEL